jgi:uncharacterized protein (DUF1778 family)
VSDVADGRRTAENKDERLQLRLDAHAKNRLQRAASYRHKTVSQFVLTTALEAADEVIRENEIVTLSNPDWKLFFDALADPPAPNPALVQAFERYRKANG